MDDQKREALTTIIRNSERSRDLARASGGDFLAFLLEGVLHEARAELIGARHAAPTTAHVAPFKRR